MRQLTLRIKRVYFEEIRCGDKSFELRADNDYYRKRFEGQKYDKLHLHYQRAERLFCDIVSITRVRTPTGVSKTMIPTKLCWMIVLRNPSYKVKGVSC